MEVKEEREFRWSLMRNMALKTAAENVFKIEET